MQLVLRVIRKPKDDIAFKLLFVREDDGEYSEMLLATGKRAKPVHGITDNNIVIEAVSEATAVWVIEAFKKRLPDM